MQKEINFDKIKILQIINYAINSVKPGFVIPSSIKLEKDILTISDNKFDLSKIENIFVVGMGKASAEMANILESVLENKISDGIVVTKENHSSPTKIIKVLESAHPFPDERSLTAGKRIAELCFKAKKNDLVIILISGGGSVLAELLKDGVSFSDWIALNKYLVNSGASIQEINSLRKKVSQIKNGGLLNFIFPAKSISLIISDVIGDPVEFIASSPTYNKKPNSNTIQEIIYKYKLKNNFSANFIKILELEDNDQIHNSCKNYIIGNNELMINQAKVISSKLDYEKIIIKHKIDGNIEEVSKIIADDLLQNKNSLIIYGGETTVTVTGNGKGGRNQELALRVLNNLRNCNREFVFASVGSDGTDGITNAAGAIVTSDYLNKFKSIIQKIPQYLLNNDSFNFHKKLNSLIYTGPTKTNVMDIMIGYLK